MLQISRSAAFRKVSGFTLLEIAFVLLVVGIVASMLVPTVASVHQKSMADEDHRIISDLKDVLIGQFLATGKLPVCMTSGAAPVVSTGNCDTVNSIGNLGVRVTDSRGNPIQYDVWDVAATSLTTSDLTATNSACARLAAAIPAIATPVVGGLATCSGTVDYNVPATWLNAGPLYYCTATNNVAFVLVASGNTRNENTSIAIESALGSAARPGNRNRGGDRIFENRGRPHSEKYYYDDVMEVVTFPQLLTAVSKFCP